MEYKMEIRTETKGQLHNVEAIIAAAEAANGSLGRVATFNSDDGVLWKPLDGDTTDTEPSQSEPADALKQWVKDYIEEQGFVDPLKQWVKDYIEEQGFVDEGWDQSEPADALKQWVKDYIEEQGFVDEDRAREISEELDVTDAVTEEIDNRELISRDDIEYYVSDGIDNTDWSRIIESNNIVTTDDDDDETEEKVRVALISLLSADEEESSDDDESDDDE